MPAADSSVRKWRARKPALQKALFLFQASVEQVDADGFREGLVAIVFDGDKAARG